MAKQRLVDVSEAAEYLHVHTRTLRRWIADGRLTGFRVGTKLLRVDMTEVESLITTLPTVGTMRERAHATPKLPCPECGHMTALDGVLVNDHVVDAFCEHASPLCPNCCEALH